MNDQVPDRMNPEDERIAQKLSQVAEQIHARAEFATELEERLRTARDRKPSWWTIAFKQISPVLRWAVLMILLAIVLSWSIRTLIPTPEPAAEQTPAVSETFTPTAHALPVNQTATPFIVESVGYDWRGTNLYFATSLPESPDEANVYMLQPEQPVSVEEVRALADQFGMGGEILEAELEPNAPSAFSVVDGVQRLNVRSDRYFEYIADDTKLGTETRFSIHNPNAEAMIAEFMQSHHFDFPYTVEISELYQAFYVQAISPDALPIHHEFFRQNGLLFTLNDTEIISVSGSLLKYDSVGTYGIISAEQAVQQVIAGTEFNGMIEGVHASEKPPRTWIRSYPNNETVTLYGFMNVGPSTDGTGSLVSIDHFIARGNLAGTENLEKLTLVKATGQFTLENDDQVFLVESWEIYKTDDHGFSSKDTFLGTLQKQGETFVLVSEKGTFTMSGVPAEVPLPLENAYVYGVALGDVLEWEGIVHLEGDEVGGGGGSSGNGFYKLNLSGPPIPFPTPTPTVQPDSNPDYIEYVIQDGDTVLAIAEAYGVSPETIHQSNSWLDGGILTPGKTLLIPVVQTGPGTAEYTVRENDTLASIAYNFDVSIEELQRVNNLSPDGTIFLGQRLIIPVMPSVQSSIGQRLDGMRGIFYVTIFQKVDGSQRLQYGLAPQPGQTSFDFMILEGAGLQDLQTHNNLPLDIWGSVARVDPDGSVVVQVEQYEIPYPELQVQLLTGKQRVTEVDGQQVVLFTTADGTTYAQTMMPGIPDANILGVEGDDVILEVVAIPWETFGGYPIVRIFSGGLATNPKDGQSAGMTITANLPYIGEERSEIGPSSQPSLTIEEVELVYYVPDSRYTAFGEGSNADYIQPAWRLHGHYQNGHEFESLIQALKQEFLLPELAPYTRPG